MNDTEQKRIFLAILLSGLVLVTWQAFVAPKVTPPTTDIKSDTLSSAVVTNKSDNPVSSKNINNNQPIPQAVEREVSLEELVLSFENNNVNFLSNLSVTNFKSSSSIFPFKEIFNHKNPHNFYVVNEGGKRIIPQFSVVSREDNKIIAKDDALDLNFVARLESNGKLNISLSSPYQYRFTHKFSAGASEDSAILKEYIVKLVDVERFSVDASNEFGEGVTKWFGLDYHYHIFNFVNSKKTPTKFAVDNNSLIISTINPANTYEGYFVFTKKNYDHLEALGDNLHLSVDFGFFGIFAEPILRFLQFIYKYIPNYGLAIIVLTILFKLATFPLMFKSFKSMKKMQKLQPELQKIKEKFKDDVQRQQKETMELFKKAGANPLGSCLPILLQMPIFFALFRVLQNSVELVQAPFYFWIQDLSVKDPYYVLPIAMGLSMVAQTKLNPSTTTDPMQQKMMMFMPLIFTFFMKDLPAGLNLYIFVSTIFGIGQQLAVYKLTD